MNKRIKWIDQAKGIGIILVVLGHMNIPIELSTVIFSFHMPLFFMLSGVLFNELKYSKDLKTVVMSKSSTLLWPFFTFTLLYSILYMLFILPTDESPINYLTESLKNSLTGSDSVNTPLWFLTALLSTEIIFSQIIRFSSTKITVVLVVIISVIIGLMNAYYWKYHLPFNLHIAIVAVFFFYLGWLYQHSQYIYSDINIKWFVLFGFMSGIVTGYVALLNTQIDMYDNFYGNIFYFFAASILGIVTVIMLSNITVKLYFLNRLLQYLGKNSLIIMSVHVLFSPLVVSIVGHLPYRIDRLLSLLLILLSIEMIHRFIPKMLKIGKGI